MDGHAKGGGALSAVAATGSPIIFLGGGEHFEDLEKFDAKSFIFKILGLGDVRGSLKAMDDANLNGMKTQEQLKERLAKGEFTLRDMYQQFQSVLNMGPLNKVMGMIPDMRGIHTGGNDGSNARIKKFIYMMDSMNNNELDGKFDFSDLDDAQTASRIRRIAAGSGCHPNEVKMLLATYKQMETMVSKYGKAGLMGGKNQAMQQQIQAQMKKDPNFINKRLNQMGPKFIEKMGGREHIKVAMEQVQNSRVTCQ